MMWGLVTSVAVAAVLFAIVTRQEQPRGQILWLAAFCALWPIVLVGFVLGSAIWLVSSLYHDLKTPSPMNPLHCILGRSG
jgi:hypothetical protein